MANTFTRFDSGSGAVTVANVLGVTSVTTVFPGVHTRQDWGRVGFDIDGRLDRHSLFSISGHAASAGQDADFSGAVSYRYSY